MWIPIFLNIFNFRALQGDPRALAEPGRLFLTPALANGLFGSRDLVGQTVIAVDNQPYTVAGIIEAPPRRSHLQFDAPASYASTTAQSE